MKSLAFSIEGKHRLGRGMDGDAAAVDLAVSSQRLAIETVFIADLQPCVNASASRIA